VRAATGSVTAWESLSEPLEQAVFVVLDAQANDAHLAQLLPGTCAGTGRLRRVSLRSRPPLSLFPPHRQPLEVLLRRTLEMELDGKAAASRETLLATARSLAGEMRAASAAQPGGRLLYRDFWTGEFRRRGALAAPLARGSDEPDQDRDAPPKSARLNRTPQVREAPDDEDYQKQGAWMVQTSQPMEKAEDPIGLQRPTDRDESTASEELADSLSELPEARLVSAPGRPKEILLSEDAPEARTIKAALHLGIQDQALRYPEWDFRAQAYIEGGVTVHVRAAAEGPQGWVERTMQEHRTLLDLVRRRFEMLKARRVRLRKQLEGDDIDLDAFTEGYCDYRAGLPLPQGLYQTYRQARRDMAILVLVDISGSTDGWVSSNRRVIDVERDALLLVSFALQGMSEPNAVQAFSGEGPRGVLIRTVKHFDESFSDSVARRIASLEPEHYTRAGAAIRHATASLMQQSARHRLLLLVSDGKPNDIDDYEGQYGVADMRQAVIEARLQGIKPFCLTVDRQAAAYLPGIFGAHQYGLLPRPDLLPTVLLDWMRRLISA
jgi:nitric oxide reductase NorD protein